MRSIRGRPTSERHASTQEALDRCEGLVRLLQRQGGGRLWRVQSPTWSPACHEQLSWRFHWWRHSHSVPVRWRRGVARAAAVVEQAVRAAHPEPQATQAAREAVRAATALLNHPAAKAVRLAILLLNRPAVRAKIALIPQGRELALVPRRGARAEPPCGSAFSRWLAADVEAHFPRCRSLLGSTVGGKSPLAT